MPPWVRANFFGKTGRYDVIYRKNVALVMRPLSKLLCEFLFTLVKCLKHSDMMFHYLFTSMLDTHIKCFYLQSKETKPKLYLQ